MVEHPTLYAKQGNNIIFWRVDQDGSRYRIIKGIKDSIPYGTNWIYAKAVKKNLTDEEQANLDIQKFYQWKKEVDFFEDLDALEKGRFVPMIANKIEYCGRYVNFPVLIQRNIKGYRALCKKDQYHTESGKILPSIWSKLELFFQKYPNAILDGNIARDHQSRNYYYYIYDGYGFGADKEECFSKRKKVIDNILPEFDFYQPVETFEVNSYGMINFYKKKFKNRFKQGVYVRILGKPYEHGYSNFLLKDS